MIRLSWPVQGGVTRGVSGPPWLKDIPRLGGHAPGGQRGFALLIVLWTLVLITLVVSELSAAGRSETRLARNLLSAETARQVADGALYQAVLKLMEPGPARWIADGRVYELRLAGGVARVSITDEAGKVDPNTASIDLLAALVHSIGADTQTARTVSANIIAWRFPSADPQLLRAQYESAGRSYVPPAAPFQTLDEIGLVLGVTPDLLARLRPHLTIEHTGDPIPALADPVVRRAILEQSGAALVPPTSATDQRVVAIDATATTNAAKFTRHAIVSLEVGRKAGIWSILLW